MDLHWGECHLQRELNVKKWIPDRQEEYKNLEPVKKRLVENYPNVYVEHS